MTENPYSAGTTTAITQLIPATHRPRTFAVGMSLLVSSIAWLFGLMFGTNYILLAAMEPDGPSMFPAYCFFGFAFFYNIMLVVGATKILRNGSYLFARVTLCLALVPFVGPFYFAGIGIGIWGLILLRKPEVRASFED